MEPTQLERLTRPFPSKYIAEAPKGKHGSYVPHHVYNQALIAVVGPFSWRIQDVLRGATGNIEGCIGELTVTIDGNAVTICEPGDCEMPTNWKTDGARLKDAASDAFKRCCMRLGLGLHLWAGRDYFLYDQLSSRSPNKGEPTETPADGSTPLGPSAKPVLSPRGKVVPANG